HLEAAGGAVERRSWTAERWDGEEIPLTNIAARFGPRRDGGLLLGTHWDSRAWANEDPDTTRRDEPVPGANDGASGTAVLLALADLFARRPPPIPVQLVLFDGEDQGDPETDAGWVLGSERYAAQPWEFQPEAGIVIDMICRPGQLIDWDPICRQLAPDVHRLIAAAEEARGLKLLSHRLREPILDDHLPLLRAGLPTALLIGYGDPDWHTVADLPDNCSDEPLRQIGTLLVEIIYGGYLH
ncbi:MAG: M28 family peptidase, partial [Candidatus Eisenbacteria bacterium]|nr:M28 family peptidase [Candidatus Eisenbacteria bacterium]